MKVSTRIVAGFGTLMVLFVLALAYQVTVIHQMQSINRELSSINLRASESALRMLHQIETVDEFSKKYFLVDPIYEDQLNAVRGVFFDDLTDLRNTVRSDREKIELQRLAAEWDEYWLAVERHKKSMAPGAEYFPIDLAEGMSRLRAQTRAVYDLVQLSVPEQVRRAAAAGNEAERVSIAAGIFAMLVGGLIALLIVRAINAPLRQLTAGTHRLAKGQFWHRLQETGGDEFSEVARDFNDMAHRLGELDQMKKDFVSHVSHELKAPLASMRQMVHLLLQGIPGSLTEQQNRLLRLTYNSAERLSSMVGNLLDVSRMEAGSMEYELRENDLVALVKAVAEEFEAQAEDKGVHLRVECSHDAVLSQCDRDRIIQVVGNLFENALKFSPRDTEVVARVEYAGHGDAARGYHEPVALISVADFGPGVAAAHKEKIFLKFHQVNQGRKLSGQGVGLGLAICRTIVEAHQGSIWVDDNPAGGSVFFFLLRATVKAEVLQCS